MGCHCFRELSSIGLHILFTFGSLENVNKPHSGELY
jgi:hypothetical protein